VIETPAGLVLRPYADESDVAAIVELMNAEWAADNVPWRASLADKQAEYRHPSEMFDPRRDVTLAEVDGVPVGYAVRLAGRGRQLRPPLSRRVLNVDAANATGALGLYERAGFEVSHRSTVWRRPLDNGGRR
jgi:hypothetical protein